LTHV